MAGTRVGAVEIAITGETDPFRRAMMQAEAQGRRSGQAISREMQRVDAQTKKATASLGGMGSALGALAAVGGLVALGNQLVHVADDFSLMRSRIRLVVAENESLLEIEEKLADQAMTNRADLKSTVALYSRLRAVRKDLSDEAARDIVDKWAKTLIVSGASAQEAAAATMQFGQAMASGRLGGDELRSILEANSRFAILLADGLGVTVGQLRQLGEEGKLTTDAIVGAMKEAGGSLESDFGKKALTVGQATTNLQTAMIRLVGVMDQSAGASATLAKWVANLADGFSALTGAMQKDVAFAESVYEIHEKLGAATNAYAKAVLAASAASAGEIDNKRQLVGLQEQELRNLRALAAQKLDQANASLGEAEGALFGLRILEVMKLRKQVVGLTDDLAAVDNALQAKETTERLFSLVAEGVSEVDKVLKKAGLTFVSGTGPKDKPADAKKQKADVQELVGYTTDLERLHPASVSRGRRGRQPRGPAGAARLLRGQRGPGRHAHAAAGAAGQRDQPGRRQAVFRHPQRAGRAPRPRPVEC
jgi:tape measure domain-containing protein